MYDELAHLIELSEKAEHDSRCPSECRRCLANKIGKAIDTGIACQATVDPLWAVHYHPDNEYPIIAIFQKREEARAEALRIIHERRSGWKAITDEYSDEQLLDEEDLWCRLTRGNENIYIDKIEIGKSIDLF